MTTAMENNYGKETNMIRLSTSSALAVLLITVCTATSVFGQGDYWGKVDSSLEWVRAFLVRPTGEVFAGGENTNISLMGNAGIKYSADNGATWTTISSTLHALTFATDNTGNIYAGTFEGLYRSSDNGSHWDQVGALVGGVTAVYINSLGRVFAATAPGPVFVSADHGLTWTKQITLSRIRFGAIFSFVQAGGGTVFAGSDWGGAFVSRNDGKTWRPLKPGIFRKDFRWSFALSPNGSIVGAGNTRIREALSGKVYRSNDLGFTWSAIDAGKIAHGVSSIVIDGSGTLYVGNVSGNGVYRSADNGLTWSQINTGLSCQFVHSLAITSDGHLLAGAVPVFVAPGAGIGSIFRSANTVVAPPFKPSQSYVVKDIPEVFALHQNYPNPFNPATTVEFELATSALVTVKVFNTLGQEVAELIHGELMDGGTQELEFDASALPSGAYHYRLVAQDVETGRVRYTSVKKMMLLK